MNKNLDELANKLQLLISQLPDNFALQNTKYYMKRALVEMNLIQKKREKRKQAEIREVGYLDAKTAQNALNKIDELIEIEKRNLESIKQKPTEKSEFLLD